MRCQVCNGEHQLHRTLIKEEGTHIDSSNAMVRDICMECAYTAITEAITECVTAKANGRISTDEIVANHEEAITKLQRDIVRLNSKEIPEYMRIKNMLDKHERDIKKTKNTINSLLKKAWHAILDAVPEARDEDECQ